MDGVVHPNVEQAIGRDRIRKALKRYENRPADEHRYGIVRSVNDDGSYEVLLDGDVQTSRCAQYGTALVGDRVLAVTKKDGRNDLIGRLGGETIAPTIAERFEGIESDILDMRTNKVLWSGDSWPKADQTITLSEAVSAQPNGIVLVWVYNDYDGTNSATDYGWVFQLVPKSHVAMHNGKGVVCEGYNPTGNIHFIKYVYVSDTSIVGNAQNDVGSTNMNSGVVRNNQYASLRYVIGV